LAAALNVDTRGRDAFAAAAPWLFVVLWSTGFIATKIGVRDCPPFTLLVLRFALATTVLVALAVWLKSIWPREPRVIAHLAIVGLLNQACYLGLSFKANALGMPVSVLALIGALQPVLTALGAAWLLHERVGPLQWLGLALGLMGVGLVLLDRVAFVPSFAMIALASGSILAITAGTLHQKRYCGEVDLLAGTAIQFLAGAPVLAVAAWLTEPLAIEWTPSFVGALLWLTVVNSIISVNLLYRLIRRGEASRVASLFYLVPPVTSVMAWFTIDERFGEWFFAGASLALAGVVLAMRAPRVRVAAPAH